MESRSRLGPGRCHDNIALAPTCSSGWQPAAARRAWAGKVCWSLGDRLRLIFGKPKRDLGGESLGLNLQHRAPLCATPDTYYRDRVISLNRVLTNHSFCYRRIAQRIDHPTRGTFEQST
jgi:hypothetical protein